MKNLKISDDISLPLDFVTQAAAILAKRRAGKSYTMRRIAEQLLKADQQIVLVDPKGDQWGIRSSADGKGPGYPITILGGEHGDVPLEVGAGELVAKLVVEDRVSVLLDLSMFRKHEVATFMTAFMENLYRLKAQEAYRTPVMLIIDEADAIAPQKPQKGEERMLGAAEDIVRRGGQRGIGCLLITQRSAVLNKNVLTQAQMLIVLRTIAPQDLAAMRAWIEVHGTIEEGKEMMDSLPSLPVGDAYFWSPGWPTNEGIFQRSHVLPIETFDSGATPKPGEKKIVPRNLADVDLDALKKQMAATIENQKANDPKFLKTEVARLTKELARNSIVTISQEDIQKAAGHMIVARDKEWKEVVIAWSKRFEDLRSAAIKSFGPIHDYLEKNEGTANPPLSPDFVPSVQVKEIIERPKLGHVSVMLTGPEQKVLDAIAWMQSIGVDSPERSAVAFLAGYSNTRSTGFTNPCGALRSKGFIEYPNSDTITLTLLGEVTATPMEITHSNESLQQIILDKLPGPESKLLRELITRYPEQMSNEELCMATGYTNERSTGYTNPRGRLKSFGFVEYPTPGMVRARDVLFPL